MKPVSLAYLLVAGLTFEPIPVVHPQPARPNRVLELDGKNSYMELPDNLCRGLSVLTCEAWIRSRGTNRFSVILSLGSYFIGCRPVSGEVWVAGPSQWIPIGGLLRSNQWCHIAAVFDKSGITAYL